MQRHHALTVAVVALAVAGAAAGYWFLTGQQVTVEVAYGSELAGRTVAVSLDGSGVGELVVPGNRSCSMAMTPCIEVLGDLWRTRGLHSIHATIKGATVLGRAFAVGGRAYVVVMVYWDGHADLYVGDTPPLWL